MNRIGVFQGGFSLIETLIAFMLVSIMGGAVVYILAQVTSLTRSADVKTQGTSYANQAIEAVRDYYQTNYWLSLAGKDADAPDMAPTCYGNVGLSSSVTCSSTYSACTALTCESLPNNFYRQISIFTKYGTPSKVSVTVNVFWMEKGKEKKALVDAAFYNY